MMNTLTLELWGNDDNVLNSKQNENKCTRLENDGVALSFGRLHFSEDVRKKWKICFFSHLVVGIIAIFILGGKKKNS